MASRRQKQMDRKYSSFRKYTATEDVNYSTHSSRSSYRSESLTSHRDSRGRSTSSELIAGSETRSYPVCIAIQDYQPDEPDGIQLEQGQIVEVLDKQNSARWLVRTKARPPRSGWVPGSYFETPTEYYKQRRRTRELQPADGQMTDEQEAVMKRDQVYHDLLRSEEEFVAELRSLIDTYIRIFEDANIPEEIRSAQEKLTMNLPELSNFHSNVMLKGLNYYSDDPGKVGQTFIRLERDFDLHVQFYRDLPAVLELIETQPFKDFFLTQADKAEAGTRSFGDHLRNIADRMTQYQGYFKEFVKYSSRANQDSRAMQKALELTQSIPQRVHDMAFTTKIQDYPGDTNKLGRLIRHDAFKVTTSETGESVDRYVFLFKNKLMITERLPTEPVTYRHLTTIRLDKYTVRSQTMDEDTLVFSPNEPGLPDFTMKPIDFSQAEYQRKAWLRDIAEEQEEYARESAPSATTATTVSMEAVSDFRSEFSEYSGSRKSSTGAAGPEEGGPPRKKIKSPPAISPTGSSTSLYSGGSSSIDWTTTGTTLEMQGTRVTRTQYGFRTLQESSAKMCLKVTGYPLPAITWFKDDVQLNEDERHTFYADEDGFFAMTIDPVQVEDTGRYTCMATNEYGQASTSAFFRVLKVEKEAAPPAFVNSLKDQECREGEVCSFECEVEGWPEPELVWLVDDQPLRPSHDFRLQYDGQVAKLEIRDAQPDDTGVYTVKIQNEFGTVSSKAELVVVPDPDKNHVAPEFQAVIEDVECREGDEVKFKAVITGDPNPEITWLINGIPLSESEKVRFISEDGICILTIKDVTRHFDGIVTCQGTNRLGSANCDARLRVIVPPTPPSFNKTLEDKTVQENSNVVFEVDVNGWPEPTVAFFLKGKELQNGVDGVEITGADGFFRVVINKCTIDAHDGEILARATNEHGTAESRARLTVEPPEEESRSAPTFIKDIEDQTVKHGEFAVFETSVRGSPNPDVIWFINGHKMDATSPGVKIEVVNHDHKLTVDSAHYAGTVLCRAENVVGRFETKARLIVLPAEIPKKPPRFIEELKDRTDVEGSTVVFEVRVEGEPKPEVKWFIDGKDVTERFGQRVAIREFDNSIKLEIRDILLADAGEIKCVATNSEGSAESVAKLGVNRKPFAPKFIETPQSITVTQGESAEFRARADAEPAPSYTWSIDGRKVRDSTDGASVQTVDGVSILRIDTSVFGASATISVVAENSLGADETGARLTVNPKQIEAKKLEETKIEETKVEEIKVEMVAPTRVEEEKLQESVKVEETAAPAETTAEVKVEETKVEVTEVKIEEVLIEQPKNEEVKPTEEQKSAEEPKVEQAKVEQTLTSEPEKPEEKPQEAETKKEEPQSDEVTTEEPKPEESFKKEEPKPEETKPEEPKSAEPKPEESKPEEAKPEEAKSAEPKPEEHEPIVVEIGKPQHPETGVVSDISVEMEPLQVVKPTEATVELKEEPKAEEGAKAEQPAVQEAPKPAPIMKRQLQTQTVNRGDLAHFEVVVEHADNVRWFHDGKQISATANGVKISQDEAGEFRLSLDSSVFGEGVITVEAYNQTGTTSSKCDMKVLEPMREFKKPEFTDTLKDMEILKGKPFQMDVIALNSPQFKWFLNGKQLEDGKDGVRIVQEENKSSLMISEATDAHHQGTVTVEASNEVGKSECSGKLTVIPPSSAPQIVSGPTSVEIIEKETAEFKTTITGYPAPTVIWTLNEKQLDESSTVSISQIGEEYRLTIKEASTSQTGTVKVSAQNSAGSDSKSVDLKVKTAFVAPEFDSQLHPTTATEGEPLNFGVTLKGNPEGTNVEWLLNDKPLSSNDRVSITDDGKGNHKLVIGDAKPNDSGSVKVKATNPAGVCECEASVKVNPKAVAPQIVSGPSNREIFEKETVEFKATVTGIPAPTVQWSLNEKVLEQSSSIVVSQSGEEYSLTIKETSIDQKGTIKISAQNTAGSDSKATELVVKQKTTAPQITSAPVSREVTEKETVEFKTTITGVPAPTVAWSLNEQTLQESSNVVISQSGEQYSLVIKETTVDQKGTVKVTATNEAGSDSKTAELGVSPKATAPQVLGLSNKEVKEKETVEFKTTITGYPEPTVRWSINETVVEESSTVIKTKSGNDYSITLKEVSTSQQGTVKVHAENSAGSDSKTAELKVIPSIETPKFAASLSDTTVNEGEPLHFEVAVTGNPQGTTVEWLLNGQPLKAGDGVTVSDDGNGKFKLDIAKAKPENSGTLTAKATNPAGSCETSAKVTVNPSQGAPVFTKKPQDHETTIGESVKFSAVVEGKPTPQVSWYLKGKKLENNDDVKVKREEDTGKASIRIHKPQIEDSGEVKVVAENAAGKAEATAKLKVDRKTEVPKFTTNMDDRQVNEGTTVKYTSVVEGYPEPTVEWTLNGEPVSKHTNIAVSDSGNEHTIEIKEITPEQAGELSCVATNSVGFKKQNVLLAVKRVGEAPTFARNLEDRLVTESEVTIMEAKLNIVKPKPTITWLRDGKELKADDHWSLTEAEDGTLTLKIVTTNMEDKGRITIKAENYFGAAECAASLGVVKKTPMAKPAFQSDIAPITITEGESLQTKLLITGNPTPFVKWYINGQLVCETPDTEISNANGVYSLTIHGCTADMTGKIKCVAYNKAGEVSTEGPLKVIAPIPVEFETSLCDATCREGDTLKLKAVLLGEPTPVVSWYVNGKKLEESQNIKIHAEKGTYTVTIKDITCDYTGKVVCEAVNEYGKASSEAMLLVLPRGEPPDFLEWLNNVRARQGSKVVHKVVFTGDPKPVLTWYINNKEVTNGSEFTIVTDDKTSTLTINNFNPDVHVGEIICKAENDAGEVSCTANMSTYTSDMFSESESEAQMEEFAGEEQNATDDESFREEIQRTPTPVMAPKFITKIKDTRAKRGHEAIFECVVPDTKGVCCKWLKDGKEIELIARIRVQTRTIEGHTTQELIIEDVQPEDAGKYTVIVENSAGKDVCEATLTVLESFDKPADKAPEFTTKLTDKVVNRAEKVTLECKVDGHPPPTVSWYREDVKISESSEIHIESHEQVQRLTIDSAEQIHQGKYSCIAENTVGTTKTEALLTVQAEAPVFTKQLEQQHVSIGSKFSMSCSVKGSPQPLVEFYREETKITTSERISVEHDKTNTHWRIVVKDVRKEDIATYRAVATNSAGSATSTAEVRSKDVAPVFEQGLKKATVKEKDEIHMEVKVSGTAPEIEWFKDGKPVSADGKHELKKGPEDGVFQLIVKDATLADAGTYSCKAKNPAGEAQSAADMGVEQLLKEPEFTEGLKPLEVKEHESLAMSVTVTGVPEPTVSWQKDGRPIEIDNAHVFSKDEGSGHFTLTIKDARQTDVGSYSCTATNKAGQATTSAKMGIQEELKEPQFTEGLKPQEVKEHESLAMSVTVTGTPEPTVVWQKDGRPIEIDNQHVFTKDEGSGHFTLTIKDARQTDVGSYSCVATNKAGQATTSANMGVQQELKEPEFTEGLKPQEVKEHESLAMSVTVTGSPEPTVTWQKDGRPIEIDNQHVFAKDEGSGHFTLTIKDARQTDVGSYSCVATNKAGQATTSANMGVQQELKEPEFTQGLQPLEVKEQETIKMSVSVTGIPEPEVKWEKDGRPIEVDNQHVFTKDEGHGYYSLTIKDARQSDVGSYSCIATNKAGQATTSAKMGVQEVLKEPEFTEGLQPMEVKENENLNMSVTVTGTPEPTVTWQKDGHPIEIDNQHVFAKDEGNGHFTLTIKQARVGDVGSYSCTAVNKVGQATTSAKMGVEESVESPHFVEGLKTLETEPDAPAELKVSVEGKPEPQVTFYKDGVEVQADAQHSFRKDGDGKHTLVIRGVTVSDVGSYSCVAVNTAGRAETIGELKVPKYAFEKTKSEEVAPLFIEELKPMTAKQGETVELSCRVNTEAKPQIQFYRNEKPVELGPHMELLVDEEGRVKLTIHNATAEDVGTYRCEAVNKVGKAETNAPLKFATVVEEKVADESESLEEFQEIRETTETATAGYGKGAPEFIELLRSCTVALGQTATLKCRVRGEPKPTIRWTKDGKEVVMSTRIKTEFKEDGTLTLTVTDATNDDAGEYRCEAENEYGSAWTEGPIIVTQVGAPQPSGDAPDFIQPVRPVVVEEGETAVLEGKIAGKPKPTVKWYKNGELIKASDRVKIEDLEDGTQRLTVKDAKMSDMDEYRCEASNEHGDVWSDVTLTVKEKHVEAPEIVRDLKAVAVVEGKKAEFECRITGVPRPDVKWFKDGKELTDTSELHLQSESDGTEKLIIDSAKAADQGNYRVEATNAGGSMSSKAPLTVTPAEDLKLKRGLTDVTVERGTRILLSVEVEGKPKTVKWYKATEQVTESSSVKIRKVSDFVYELEMPSAELSASGSYKVVLSTELSSVESSCTVTVTEKPAKVHLPSFKKGLNDQELPKGSKLALEVEIEGSPKSVKWLRNGKEVPGEDLGNGKYRLVVPELTDDTAGEYCVVAENDAGEVESRAKITVKPVGGKPEIVSGLVPTTVKKGETATFTVKTKGPVKQVKWYKNGKEIPNPNAKDLGDGTYALDVPNAQPEDAADYKVVLSNDDGTADSFAALTVKLPKLELVKGLEDQAVDKGKPATLEIKTNEKPKSVKWYKNGKEIASGDKAKPEDDGGNTYRLKIPDADEEDTADYKVVLKDDDGNEVDSSCALTVKLPRLELLKGLEDTVVPLGQNAELVVKANGKPKQVKWYKNGKEITPSDKAKPEEGPDNTFKLKIPNAEEEDAAEYKVVLVDDAGNEADSSCQLTVKQMGFKKGLEDEVLPVGSPLKLAIETVGVPKTVKWYKNGKELSHAAGKVNIKKVDDNNYLLEIPSAAVGDSGEYKVEIENEVGKATSQGKITVEPKITFLKPLKDVEVVEGENAEFVLETNVKPRTVKWYKNGQEIKPDSHFVVSEEKETVFKLVIKTTKKDDAATYKIALSNSAGEVDSAAALTVKKPKAGVPKIIKGLEDQVVAKGQPLVFEVKIEGEPDEVRWLKDATPVKAQAVIEKIDDQTYRLTIPSADLSDAGQYTVELITESGKAKSDAKGEVDEKPEIVKGLNDLELDEGDDDVFKVEVSAPVRTVKWYKNGQEIKPSAHLEPKKIGPKKYELAINKGVLDDSATYKVVLANAAGECDSSAALTVKKPNVLKLIDGLKDVDVDEGQPIELKARVEGIPKSVKWYKNGQEISPSANCLIEQNADTGEYTLRIPSSTKPDGGAYRIVLSNDKGEVYSGSVAHVKAAKPSAPAVPASFLTPLKDVEVEEGDTLTLTCKVGGEPLPEIAWEKDGVPITKDDRTTMRVALDGTVTLRIRDARSSDVGTYKVTATNASGSASSTASAAVKTKGEEPIKPRFIVPLKSCEAAIGDKKEFTVKIRGVPKPELTWTINDRPLQFDDRVVVEDIGAGNWCLTIKEVREEDFGTLRCVARNELGQDECQAEFDRSTPRPDREKDDDRYPPRFNVPLWDRRIPSGDPMSIECHVDAKPTATIEWFKDDKPLIASDRIEIRNSSDGACRVRIAGFNEEDVGIYKCVATNPLGVADTRSNYAVEVYEPEEKVEKRQFAPRFNPGLEDKNVNAGDGVTLSCAVSAEPKAAVTWYKDGLPLRADGRIKIDYAEDGTCTLSIPKATDGDAGAYRCVATNEHGTTNTSCLVAVKTPKTTVVKEGEEPFFTKNLVDAWTDRGETFTLSCAVKGDPFPEIKWYRNGQLVRNSPRCTIETSPDGTCQLTVKECTMADEGIYRCEAENKHGKAKTQCTTHVQMSLGKADKPKLEEGQAPRFIIPLEDVNVIVGGVIDLECKVTGQPMPHVKWSKDGGPIWEDPRYDWDIDEAKGTYHLRIKNAVVGDEGTYRCVATNESGSATTKAFARIDDGTGAALPAGKASAPRFTIRLGDARATEGQPLKLECKIEGSPLPQLTWHKDGAQVLPSDRIQLSLSPDGIARLVIPSCVVDDEGIYRITATNPSGSAQDKGNAIVKRAPRDTGRGSSERPIFDANKAPRLLEPLSSVRVPEKDAFKLRCRFSGEPKPNIKWFKDGDRVFPYGRLRLNETDDGWCELIVDSASRQDAGGYRCVAENSYGTARTTCDVTVISKDRKPRDIGPVSTGKAPGFTIPLTIKRAKPGDDVVFECLPFGDPFPAIKWLKDGLELIPDIRTKTEALPDGTQRLTLSGVGFFSEGYYRCVATNSHGTASTKAELCIEGDRTIGRRPVEPEQLEPEESKPRIRRGLHNMSEHQGNTIEMIVCATGWPTPTVQWFKDGEPLTSDGPDGRRVIFTDERGIHHLVILNAGPEDEGEYALEATNKLGSARTEGALNIIRPRGELDYDRGGMPFPPGFVRQLKNKHVFHHMPTIFDCLVVGHPAPEVEWFHNGKKIVPDGRTKIQSCGGGSHAIIILDTKVEDAGEYVAVAKNCHGTASSSAVLDVTVPHLDNIKFNGEIDVSQYLTEEYGFKKLNFASLPTPPDRGPFIKEVTGHYLTLSWIPTKRAPPRYPQVTYVIEIRELPEKEWTLLDYNIPEPVCKVRNLELGKSYQFRVRAENIYGISDPSPASPPSRLMAPPQPVLDKRTKKVIPLLDPYAEKALDLAHAEQYACAPWFSPGVIEKRYCAENDTLTLILNVSGYPDPTIQWKFRGWDVDTTSPTSKCRVYTYGGTETTLTITGFNKENVGQYQCVATNQYGEAQQNIMVELAERPNFVQQLANRTFSSAHPMKLSVRLDGQPFPEVKWMKDWRPLVESSRVHYVQDGPGLCSLVIEDPMWRDSGIYTCVAVNPAGQATTSCTVTVEADGDYNDVQLPPKKRAAISSSGARKVHEIFEIDEEDEK